MAKTLVILTLVAVASGPLQAERTITTEDLYDRIRGMWLGQLIGNAAGRATEGQFSGSTGNPAGSVPWVLKEVWDGDDDTDLEYLAVHILETYELDPNDSELAAQWLDHVTTSGIWIANKQGRLLLADGVQPPYSGSRTYNEHWYAIDSQITTESIGAVCPAMPQAAVDLTGRFARITNDGFAVHAAQFYSVLYANAFFESDVPTLVTESLAAIPSTSRTHEVISDCIDWYLADISDGTPDWRATRQMLYDNYQGAYSFGRYYNWVESTVNVGATTIALLYGDGDFEQTVQIAVLAGWDCDCNPATAGGLIGIIEGYSGLPAELTDPEVCGDVYQNVYRPGLPDANSTVPQTEAITALAGRMTALAEQNIINHSGYSTGVGSGETWHIPDQPAVTAEPDMPDPPGPTGLVAEAIDVGITVTPTASVQTYTASLDRRNLNQIIDGITDNSHNGVRPYYTYSTAPDRPEEDFYQLGFSTPVKFSSVTFHEGDVVWSSINTYYRQDNARGGFFEDLTVEILRDGRFIEPANLTASEPLDRYRTYQSITFDFAATAGEAIRIVGTAGGSASYTTILELSATGDVDPGLFVASARINEGSVQRSQVDRIDVTFNRAVTISPAEVELAGVISGPVAGLASAFSYEPSTRTMSLSFAESLPDDMYELDLYCPGITDSNGVALLEDDSLVGDDYYTIGFHRLLGDADGSGEVDLADIAILTNHWLAEPQDTGLDTNDDGVVDIRDLARLASAYAIRNGF